MISVTIQIILWALLFIFLFYGLREGIPENLWKALGRLLIIVCLLLVFIQPNNEVSLPVLRILSIPLKPLGMSILLLLLSIKGMKKGGLTNTAKNQISVALLVLLLGSMPFIAYAFAQQFEKNAIQLRPAVENASAIVVLGWGTTQPKLGNRTQVQLTDTGDRIRYAADLYKTRLASRLIVSAGRRINRRQQQNVAEAEDIKTLLVQDMNLPSNAIIVASNGIDVRTSAVEVSEILKQQNLGDRIYLVSSALNMRRATQAFTNLNIKVIPKPTNFYTFFTSESNNIIQGPTDFVPNTEALSLTTKVIDEYLITIYYFMRGWLSSPLETGPLSVQRLPQQQERF